MLGHIQIGAGEQKTVIRKMRAGGPHLLAIDNVLVPLALRAGHGAGQIGSVTRLAKQLAPNVLARQASPQEFLPQHIRPV